MSETNVDSLGDRNDIYSQIFGVERRPDSFATFDSDSHGDISSQLLPNRIENIQNLNVLLSEDIANDIIIAKQRRRSGVEAAIDDSDIPNNEMKGKSSNYILSQQTNIKEVPDTQSLSSADNTPVSSPKKARDATSSHPIVHAKSMSHIYIQRVIVLVDKPSTIMTTLCLQCLQEMKFTRRIKVLQLLCLRGNLRSRN